MPSRLEYELVSGLVPLHILHHANEQPVYGMWIIQELAGHGYTLSAGTLYPLLHRMEKRGLLRSTSERAGSRSRRVYRMTPAGRRALEAAKDKVRELFGELFATDLRRVFGHRGNLRHPSTKGKRAQTAKRIARRKRER